MSHEVQRLARINSKLKFAMSHSLNNADDLKIVWGVHRLARTLPDGEDYPFSKACIVDWVAGCEKDNQSVYVRGSVNLDEADPANYTPYSEITFEQALGWAQAALGEDFVAQTEEEIKIKMNEKLNPQLAYGTPWHNL